MSFKRLAPRRWPKTTLQYSVDGILSVSCGDLQKLDRQISGSAITPTKARAVKSFPIGKWMYEPKWDGFRCLVFRDEENVFLQSRTGKSLTGAEIVAAFRALSPKKFVLDGELAMPTENGFSFDGLVNRLRRRSPRHSARPSSYGSQRTMVWLGGFGTADTSSSWGTFLD